MNDSLNISQALQCQLNGKSELEHENEEEEEGKKAFKIKSE